MGRHAGAPAPEPDGRSDVALQWVERVTVGLVAGGVLALVLRWTGWSWTASLAVGAAVLVVVPLAARLAATVPDHPREDDEP